MKETKLKNLIFGCREAAGRQATAARPQSSLFSGTKLCRYNFRLSLRDDALVFVFSVGPVQLLLLLLQLLLKARKLLLRQLNLLLLLL